jgi:hypothetical protein
MGHLDDLTAEIKKQPDKHYRLVRADPANVSVRKSKGYESVSAKDPEIKGTILERQVESDGTMRIGNQILMRTTVENRDRLQKKIEERNQMRLDAIKRKFLKDGEDIKRTMGKSHKNIEFIHDEKE